VRVSDVDVAFGRSLAYTLGVKKWRHYYNYLRRTMWGYRVVQYCTVLVGSYQVPVLVLPSK
jgi:hypothetical protein